MIALYIEYEKEKRKANTIFETDVFQKILNEIVIFIKENNHSK